MNRELKQALTKVITAAEDVRCENLHHDKKHQHDAETNCPVEYEFFKAAHIVKTELLETTK